MKKIFLVLLLFLGFLIPKHAFAVNSDYGDISSFVSGKDYVLFKTSTNSVRLITWTHDDTLKLRANGGLFSNKSFTYLYRQYSSSVWSNGTSFTDNEPLSSSGLVYIESTVDIYTDSNYSSVYFSAVGGSGDPPPEEEEEEEGSSGGWWSSLASLDDLQNLTGGWIATALGPVVSPITGIGDALGSGFDVVSDIKTNITTKFTELGSNIGGFFVTLGNNVSSFKSSVDGWIHEFKVSVATNIIDLGTNIGGWFTNVRGGMDDFKIVVVDKWDDLKIDIGDWLGGIGTDLVSFKDQFVLKMDDLKINVGAWFEQLNNDVRVGLDLVFQGTANIVWKLADEFFYLRWEIQEWFYQLFDKMDDYELNVGNWFDDILDMLVQFMTMISTYFNLFFDYFNPLSDNFFLKLSFVPSDDYFRDHFDQLSVALKNRFAFLQQLEDAFNAVTAALTNSEWEGIKATVPIINKELTVVNPSFVNAAAPKIKAFIGGFIVIFLFGYIIRRTSTILGSGK